MDRAEETMARLLRDAGISEGMRVLDVGCGYGRVSEMAARLVGTRGAVVGFDRDVAALAVARTRMSDLGITNVTFVEASVHIPPEGTFDAVLGRRVLMYVPDKDRGMRALVERLKPGGIVVFQELDASMVPMCSVPLPLHERVHHWIWDTVKHEGATPTMGLELAPLLLRAGLSVEHVRAECIVQAPGLPNAAASIVRGILPRILAAGAASEHDIDVETLEQRMADELAENRATFVSDVYFGAWARKPS